MKTVALAILAGLTSIASALWGMIAICVRQPYVTYAAFIMMFWTLIAAFCIALFYVRLIDAHYKRRMIHETN